LSKVFVVYYLSLASSGKTQHRKSVMRNNNNGVKKSFYIDKRTK